MNRHYTPEEANAILEKALVGKPLPGDISHEQLVRLAAEVGVTPEELDAAEAQLHARTDTDQLRKEYVEWRASRLMIARAAVAAWVLITLSAILSEHHNTNDTIPASMSILCIAAFILFVTYVKGRSPVTEWQFQRWLSRRERRLGRSAPLPPDFSSRRIR